MVQTKKAAKAATSKLKRAGVAAKHRAWSPQAIAAAREFKDVKAAPVPSKLRGKKSATIRRAVLSYYLG
jgi:hypothetical protein